MTKDRKLLLESQIKHLLELKEVEAALEIDEMDKRADIEKRVKTISMASEREKIEINESMKHKMKSVAAVEDGKDVEAKKQQELSALALEAANQHHEVIEKEKIAIDEALAHQKILQTAHQDAEKRRSEVEKKISTESLEDLDKYMQAGLAQIMGEDQWKETLHKLEHADQYSYLDGMRGDAC